MSIAFLFERVCPFDSLERIRVSNLSIGPDRLWSPSLPVHPGQGNSAPKRIVAAESWPHEGATCDSKGIIFSEAWSPGISD